MTSIINDIQKINLAIEQQCANAEWEEVKKSTVIRQQLLQDYCEKETQDMSKSIILTLRAAIEISDKKTKRLLEIQKKESIQSGLELRNAHKAVNEYRNTNNATFSD